MDKLHVNYMAGAHTFI